MKIKILSLFALLSFLLMGCESDFKLTTDWKEIPVIYAMLNENDTAHYIRVHKVFLDEQVSGTEIALIPDSVYLEGEIQVDLIQINPSGNNTKFTCTRINAADEGIVMDPITDDAGAFATDPYFLYKTTAQLSNDRSYKVEIIKNENVIANAEMSLIGELDIVNPNIIIDPLPAINLMTFNPYKVKWRYAENGEIYDVDMVLTYKETLSSGGEEIKTLKFPLANNKFPSDDEISFFATNPMEVSVTKEFVLSYILENIEANPFIEREALSLGFEFFVGGEELRFSQESSDAQAGITSSQAITIYTNVYQGDDQTVRGAGLFTSRFDSAVYDIPVSNRTKDTLHCHPLMADLNWKAHTPTVVCN